MEYANVVSNRYRGVFIKLTEMDEYTELEASLKGGGAFVEQNDYFRNDMPMGNSGVQV